MTVYSSNKYSLSTFHGLCLCNIPYFLLLEYNRREHLYRLRERRPQEDALIVCHLLPEISIQNWHACVLLQLFIDRRLATRLRSRYIERQATCEPERYGNGNADF